MISVTQVSMGTGSVDSGNSWFPWRLHLRSTGMTSVMSLCLFHNESHVSLPRQSFCVLGTRARLDDSLPKIHFVVSIATANSVLVLPCFPSRMAAILELSLAHPVTSHRTKVKGKQFQKCKDLRELQNLNLFIWEENIARAT